MNYIKKDAGFILIFMIIIILVSIAGIGLYHVFKMEYKPPVEERNTIDSLTTINDSIKIKVQSLDSIKNAKVIEVISLDNDSSIKLFYELVSE